MPQDEGTLIRTQISGGADGMRPEYVSHVSPLLLLELEKQGRRDVDGGMHFGMLFQQHRHVEVAFGRMEPHPRERSGAGQRIRIIGLVQMPEKSDRNCFHFAKVASEQRKGQEFREALSGTGTKLLSHC